MNGLLVSKEKNSSLERNCRVVKNNNYFEVFSDTIKFGKNQLMYTNELFLRCVEYIALSSDERIFLFNGTTYFILN
jgi:hypothetical protein